MPGRIHAGDLIAGRYLVADLLIESEGGRFWRAEDQVLGRHVAVHIVAEDDPRAESLMAAARASARLHDPRVLRVLDADVEGGICYIVNEWGDGTSLDIKLLRDGPLSPRKAAWVAGEVASVIAAAHEAGVAHGRLAPENVLFDPHGAVRVIGLAVEAALWGLPADRRGTDVHDLIGILYAGLTGRWAGVSRSELPPAMTETGRVLRPRQARAGIPRLLDDICDQGLNPSLYSGRSHARMAYDLESARGIAAVLQEFVGDPVGLAETGTRLALPPLTDSSTQVLSAPIPAESQKPAEESRTPAEESQKPAAKPVDGVDQPTEAGIPVFDDSDTVGWISRSPETPKPPPARAEQPDRPMFPPAPANCEPGRIQRTAAPAHSPDDYWPWGEGSRSGSLAGISTTTGHGLKIVEDEVDDSHVPGRRSMRAALAVAAITVIAVATLIIVNLLQGRSALTFDPISKNDPTSSTTTIKTELVEPVSARDFDPQSEDGSENPDQVKAAIDGDPTTAWRTSGYVQQFGDTGLKTGVGLVVDLGESRTVRRVKLTFLGQPNGVRLFVLDQDPQRLAGLDPVASVTGVGTEWTADVNTQGRYVVAWFTALPQDTDGRFRGQIAEVAVSAVQP